jgi:hypothetical protein
MSNNIQTLLRRLARFKRFTVGKAPTTFVEEERRLIDMVKVRLTAEELLQIFENPELIAEQLERYVREE